MELQQEERHEVVLRQVSDVRHRVSNLEARETLSKGFFERVGKMFDRIDALEKTAADRGELGAIEQRLDSIEKEEIKEQAVKDFKKVISSGKWLGALLGLGQLAILAKAMGWF